MLPTSLGGGWRHQTLIAPHVSNLEGRTRGILMETFDAAIGAAVAAGFIQAA